MLLEQIRMLLKQFQWSFKFYIENLYRFW
jgi:hypothetical protein